MGSFKLYYFIAKEQKIRLVELQEFLGYFFMSVFHFICKTCTNNAQYPKWPIDTLTLTFKSLNFWKLRPVFQHGIFTDLAKWKKFRKVCSIAANYAYLQHFYQEHFFGTVGPENRNRKSKRFPPIDKYSEIFGDWQWNALLFMNKPVAKAGIFYSDFKNVQIKFLTSADGEMKKNIEIR